MEHHVLLVKLILHFKVVLWVISYTVVLLKFGTALNPDYSSKGHEGQEAVTTAIPDDNGTTI